MTTQTKKKSLPSAATLGRIAIVALWALLFAALLQRDYFVKTLELHEFKVLQQDRQEDFLGIHFRGERIGYVRNSYLPGENGGMRLEQSALMHLNILEQTYPVRLELTASLTSGLELEDFDFSLNSPFYQMQAQGRVEGSLVRYQLTTGGTSRNETLRLPERPFLSINQRGFLLRQGLEPGEKIRVPYFDPVTLTGKESLVEYRGVVKELIKGRIHTLHHFSESFSGIRISSWLDDQGRVIKEESPAGFVFLAEPKFQATSIVSRGQELLGSVSVPLQGTMPPLAGLQQVRYRITLPEDAVPPISRDRQLFADGILTVHREALSLARGTAACPGPEEELADTPYIQSGHREIVDLADSLTQGAGDDLTKVQRLAAWVYDSLEKRAVIGIPDAMSTLRSRMGDCNEHAALFAALARSQSIPTRVVAGVTFQAGAFYYHAWNEVCLSNAWLSLDTTTNQMPADLGHIKFVEGETGEQIKIGSLLGRLEIEVLGGEILNQ